jgi:hypothetical protein
VLTNKKLSKKLYGAKCDITLRLHHHQVPIELYCSWQLVMLVKCKFGISQITSGTGLYTVTFGTMMCTYQIEGIHMHTYILVSLIAPVSQSFTSYREIYPVKPDKR